jgi:2'-5' RNA ligase
VKKRLFIAVDISDEARDAAARYIEQMDEKFTHVSAKWERTEKLHLTLKFLGSVEEHLIPKIKGLVDLSAAEAKSFVVEIAGTGAFPSAKNPRVLWLGVHEPTGAMNEMAKHIDGGCAQIGFEPEKRAFEPHLTLARIRDARKAGELGREHVENKFGPVSFTCCQLIIYESHLGRDGSTYEKLHAAKFRS